ncbi:hypothetical protein IW262DRAFT_1229443, partial [Armillaria fumosa]
DFCGSIGHPGYLHMAPRDPTSVNDDRIHTWPISSPHLAPTKTFSLTICEKSGDAGAEALFRSLIKLQ